MWTDEWFLTIVRSLLISYVLGHSWGILTMCMVSDEEMAKVLSHPGYSHLNGSTHQLYPSSKRPTFLSVPSLMSCQGCSFRKSLITNITDIRPMTYMRLQVPQNLLSRFELPPTSMTTCIPETSIGVFTLANMIFREMYHEATGIRECRSDRASRPHTYQGLGWRRW
jgi:hypothetical protein